MFDKLFRWIFGLQNITECYCGQRIDKSKSKYCPNCEQPLK